MCNPIPNKVGIKSFPNFNSAAVEIGEWIRNFTAHLILDVATYRGWNKSQSMLVNGTPDTNYFITKFFWGNVVWDYGLENSPAESARGL